MINMRLKDLTGQRFGRLTVVRLNGFAKYNKGSASKWLCKCDCGNEITVLGDSLRQKKTQSCGCYMREVNSKRATKHNLCGSRIYDTYHNMLARCYRKSNDCYKTYGARGITVCDEWKNDFLSFVNWAMRSGYKDNLTIERKDVNKGYSPENCTWIPMGKQASNKTTTHFVVYKGEKMTLTDFSHKVNISRKTIRAHEAEFNYNYEDLVNHFTQRRK